MDWEFLGNIALGVAFIFLIIVKDIFFLYFAFF